MPFKNLNHSIYILEKNRIRVYSTCIIKSVISELKSYITSRIIARAHRVHVIFIWKTRHPNNRAYFFFLKLCFRDRSVVDCCPPCTTCRNTREFSRPHKHRRGPRMYLWNSRAVLNTVQIHRIQLTEGESFRVVLALTVLSPKAVRVKKRMNIRCTTGEKRRNPFFSDPEKGAFPSKDEIHFTHRRWELKSNCGRFYFQENRDNYHALNPLIFTWWRNMKISCHRPFRACWDGT